MQPGFEGKRLLREPKLPSVFLDIEAHAPPDIYRWSEAEMFTFGLQTMSLIWLDFGAQPRDLGALNPMWRRRS